MVRVMTGLDFTSKGSTQPMLTMLQPKFEVVSMSATVQLAQMKSRSELVP